MLYKATRAFRFFKEVKPGDTLELDSVEYQRFVGMVEPAGIQSSSVVIAKDKKYKQGRTKNV